MKLWTCLVQKQLPNSSPNKKRKIHNILLEYFQLDPLSTKLCSSKSGIRVSIYQPNLVSRQFGLSQFLPKSLIPKSDSISISIEEPNKEWLGKCATFFKKRLYFSTLSNFCFLSIVLKNLRIGDLLTTKACNILVLWLNAWPTPYRSCRT